MKITSSGISITAMVLSVLAMMAVISAFHRIARADCYETPIAQHADAPQAKMLADGPETTLTAPSAQNTQQYKLHYLVKRSNGAVTWVNARRNVDITLDRDGCIHVAGIMNQLLKDHQLERSDDFFTGGGTMLQADCTSVDAQSSESYSGGVTGAASSTTH